MNALLNKVIEQRKGHYCHAVEVADVYELQNITEEIINENKDEFDRETIIDFLETLDVYCTNDENEGSVYSFSFRLYSDELF